LEDRVIDLRHGDMLSVLPTLDADEPEHAADIAHRQRRWHGGDLPLFAT
jgi:hypothetical protein